ncbi:MAG: hypothetical protein AB7P23_10715 [Amphiplicatus sp.]
MSALRLVISLILATGALFRLFPAPAAAAEAEIEVALSVRADGGWDLVYQLAEPARRLDLGPSLNGFRGRDWRIETDGLALISEAGRDYLAAAGTRFSRAAIRVTPRPNDFAKQYAPLRILGDGAILYTGHFWPWRDGARLDAVFSVAPSAGGHVSAFGETAAAFADWRSPMRHPAFIYVGPADWLAAGGANVLIDPATPPWIRDEALALLPRLSDYYERALRRPLERIPDMFLMIGPEAEPGRLRYVGDALPGQFQIVLSGGGWRENSAAARALLKSATAHEAAHLWLSAARPAAAGAPDWIHEGAADALADEALVALGEMPADAFARRFDEARGDCARRLDRRSLAGAEKAGAWPASYACGRALAIIAARAVSSGSVADFWASFIARAEAAGGYDEALFFAMIEERAGPDIARAVRRFPHTTYAAPDKELLHLLSLVDGGAAGERAGGAR